MGAGIGCSGSGTADNITINGGNIIAKSGGLGPGIGGGKIKSDNLLKITGGNIYAVGGKYGKPYHNSHASAIGAEIENIIIEGGTIVTDSVAYGGIFGNESNSVILKGGNLKLGGIGDIGDLNSNKDFSQKFSTDGTNILYKTQIKLQNTEENKKIESITTSDGIQYGIKDMYTLEVGMLYLYLPLGKREITIKVDGKTYKGEVETKEEGNVTVLSEM